MTAPFSAEAMNLIQADLAAHDAGDKGATECLRDLGPDLARRLVEAEDELRLSVMALTSAKALTAAQQESLVRERAEIARLQSESIRDSDAINKLQEREKALTLQLQAIELAKPKRKPAAERIEDKLKAFNQ